MSEFGSTSNQSSLIDTLQPANQNLIGWTEWAYGGNDQVGTGVDGTPPSLVQDLSQPPTGDDINTANLDTLAQPYPQVVAGTPTSFSFENGTFQFSYPTEMANGSGDFGAGSTTTISVPAVEFPNGYEVSVTGGEVVSAPNAPELVIASNAGASTISVTETASPAS
jgi:endoglycosylceramidase